MSRLVPRSRWPRLFVTPETVLRWHRDLVRRRWIVPRRGGRPLTRPTIRQLVLQMAPDNPRHEPPITGDVPHRARRRR